jgi:hypothetical protein
MNGLSVVDWLVIATYPASVTAIGFCGARRGKRAAGFFIS